jgi:hypothetical protein
VDGQALGEAAAPWARDDPPSAYGCSRRTRSLFTLFSEAGSVKMYVLKTTPEQDQKMVSNPPLHRERRGSG